MDHLKVLEAFCNKMGDKTSDLAMQTFAMLEKLYQYCNHHEEMVQLAKERVYVMEEVYGKESDEVASRRFKSAPFTLESPEQRLTRIQLTLDWLAGEPHHGAVVERALQAWH